MRRGKQIIPKRFCFVRSHSKRRTIFFFEDIYYVQTFAFGIIHSRFCAARTLFFVNVTYKRVATVYHLPVAFGYLLFEMQIFDIEHNRLHVLIRHVIYVVFLFYGMVTCQNHFDLYVGVFFSCRATGV